MAVIMPKLTSSKSPRPVKPERSGLQKAPDMLVMPEPPQDVQASPNNQPPPPAPEREPYEVPNAVEQVEKGIFEPLMRVIVRANPVEVDPNMDPRFKGMVTPFPGITLSERGDTDTLIHEAAHKADNTISGSPEFQEAVESIVMPRPGANDNFLGPGGEDQIQYVMTSSFIDDFPGVRGNPKRDLGDGFMWGGYGELFASLMAASEGDITKIPPELRPFYEPFLGPELSPIQQAIAARLTQRGHEQRLMQARSNNQ